MTSAGGRAPDDEPNATGVRRRSSSVWKNLQFKRRISKVNTKISSTLMGGDASAKRGVPLPVVSPVPAGDDADADADVPTQEDAEEGGGAAAGGVSVVNVEPEMVESAVKSRTLSGTLANADEDAIEEAIAADESLCQTTASVAAAVDTIFEPSPVEASGSQIDSHAMRTAVLPDGDNGASGNANGDQSAVVPAAAAAAPDQLAAAISRGAIPKDVRFALPQSRPTELSLGDGSEGSAARPVPMLRTKRNRMQSVPNIKLNRQDTTNLSELRDAAAGSQPVAASAAAAAQQSASVAVPAAAAGTSASDTGTSSLLDMFRRFSKYK